MIDGVLIKPINKNIDDRGWLAEIYRNDETDYRAPMAYVSVTKPGVIRGPHEHKEQSDCFIFIGPGNFDLYLWDARAGSTTKGEHIQISVGESNPSLVIVPPGVVHGYKCTSEKESYCINLPDKLYRGNGKKEDIDEIRWETDPNTPYKID